MNVVLINNEDYYEHHIETRTDVIQRFLKKVPSNDVIHEEEEKM